MGNSSPIAMIVYPIILGAPWIAAIAWVLHRTPRGDGTPPPSLGERARGRLDLG